MRKFVYYIPFLLFSVCIYLSILFSYFMEIDKLRSVFTIVRSITFWLSIIIYILLLILLPIYKKRLSSETLIEYGLITKLVLIPFDILIFFVSCLSIPFSLLFAIAFPLGFLVGPLMIITAFIFNSFILLVTSLYITKGINKLEYFDKKYKKVMKILCFFYLTDLIIPLISLIIINIKKRSINLNLSRKKYV